jgi:hypothetical protein
MDRLHGMNEMGWIDWMNVMGWVGLDGWDRWDGSDRNLPTFERWKAASTSEMSVNFYQATQRNNPEDSHLKKVFCSMNTNLFI